MVGNAESVLEKSIVDTTPDADNTPDPLVMMEDEDDLKPMRGYTEAVASGKVALQGQVVEMATTPKGVTQIATFNS